MIALEGHTVDERVLDHPHDQCITVPAELDVLEQSGRIKCLEAAVQPVRIKRIAGLHKHIGENFVPVSMRWLPSILMAWIVSPPRAGAADLAAGRAGTPVGLAARWDAGGAARS